MLSDRFCFPIGVSKMRALMSINVKCLYQKMYFPCTRRERNNLPFLCVCAINRGNGYRFAFRFFLCNFVRGWLVVGGNFSFSLQITRALLKS